MTRRCGLLSTGVQRPRFYSPVVTVDGDSLANMELILGLSNLGGTPAVDVPGDAGGSAAAASMGMARRHGRHRFASCSVSVPCSSIGWWPSGGEHGLRTGGRCGSTANSHQQAGPRVPIAVAALPPMRSMKEAMGHGEREFSLDYLTDLAVNKDRAAISRSLNCSNRCLTRNRRMSVKRSKLLAADENLDWNEALRLENMWLITLSRLRTNRQYANAFNSSRS